MFKNKSILQDCLFLSLVVIASFVFYITKLGFYSDDWSFLGNFSLSHDQSLLGLIQTATTPNTLMRPLQNIYDAVLYLFFGVHPLGYHLVNGVILIFIALMFYAVLRQLKFPRIITLALPLVYILLPNYSSDRFWYASFQANLSMLLYFFSLFAGLKGWKARSIISMILSALSYEVAIPLFFLNTIIFWIVGKRNNRDNSVFIVFTIISLLYLAIFKLKTTIRLGNSAVQNILEYPGYIFHLILSAFKVNYATSWWNILLKYPNPSIIIYGVVLGVCIFSYLFLTFSEEKPGLPARKWMRNLAIVSFIIFILGYAIFFSNDNAGFSPTGIANRIAVAGAIGVACSLVGLIGFAVRSKLFFCLLIATVCTFGFISINTLSTFWISANEKQQIVLTDIENNVPITKGNIIILDGVCPYFGPASVFESEWDLKGALQLYYHDETLQADVVTPSLEVKGDGIHTRIYSFTQIYPFYPYGKLFIYNFKNKLIYPLPDLSAANYYFSRVNPDYKTNCESGIEGNGVDVL